MPRNTQPDSTHGEIGNRVLYRVSIRDTGVSRVRKAQHIRFQPCYGFGCSPSPCGGWVSSFLGSGLSDLIDVAADRVGGLVHVGDREGQRRRERLVSGGPAWRDL